MEQCAKRCLRLSHPENTGISRKVATRIAGFASFGKIFVLSLVLEFPLQALHSILPDLDTLKRELQPAGRAILVGVQPSDPIDHFGDNAFVADSSDRDGRAGAFSATHWSVVLEASQSEVAHTVASSEEIDDEIRHLFAAISAL